MDMLRTPEICLPAVVSIDLTRKAKRFPVDILKDDPLGMDAHFLTSTFERHGIEITSRNNYLVPIRIKIEDTINGGIRDILEDYNAPDFMYVEDKTYNLTSKVDLPVSVGYIHQSIIENIYDGCMFVYETYATCEYRPLYPRTFDEITDELVRLRFECTADQSYLNLDFTYEEGIRWFHPAYKSLIKDSD